MTSYNEDYRKPVYKGKYFSVFGFFFSPSPKNKVKWYKSPASVSFSIYLFVCSDVDIFFACFRNCFFNFIIYDDFTDNFRTEIGINMNFCYVLDNDSGVESLKCTRCVFFHGVAVAKMFLFGVTNRGNRLCFDLCSQRVDSLHFGIA